MGAPILAIIGGIGGTLGIASFFRPLVEKITYGLHEKYPVLIPDIATLIDARYKGIIDDKIYYDLMKKNGYDDDIADLFYDNAKRYLTISEAITLYRRGFLKYNDFRDLMYANKVPESEIQTYLKLTEYFPSPADLIRFAVREVYSPDVVKTFKLDEDLPEKFLEEASKAGLPEEQAVNYWRAHWELPSVEQGFEMFHRGIIEKPELELLLRTRDIMPYWRDKLIELSYRVPTRVDVRRMRQVGVLEYEDVKDFYVKLGYTEEDARALADFTEILVNEDYRGLTRASIIKSYKLGLITDIEAKELLEAIKIPEDVAQFYIDQADWEWNLELLDRYIENTSKLYALGAKTEMDIRQELTSAGYPHTFIEKTIEYIKSMSSSRLKMPSKSDLLKWFEEEIIDDKTFAKKMRLLGYTEDDIENYVKLIALKRDTKQKKEFNIDTYKDWYKRGVITEDSFKNILRDLGYSEDKIEEILAEV